MLTVLKELLLCVTEKGCFHVLYYAALMTIKESGEDCSNQNKEPDIDLRLRCACGNCVRHCDMLQEFILIPVWHERKVSIQWNGY